MTEISFTQTLFLGIELLEKAQAKYFSNPIPYKAREDEDGKARL